MSDFFFGWRRQVGLVSLMMAFVLAGGWIRSWHQHLFFSCVGGQLCLRRGAIDFIEGDSIPSKGDQIVDEDGILHSPIRWSVPCWSIVWPVTLLSAFLLFTKPRKWTPKKNTEPNGNGGE